MPRETDYKKYLVELTRQIDLAIDILDDEMKKPSNAERGRRIGKLMNDLEMACDRAKHFGLGIPLEKC